MDFLHRFFHRNFYPHHNRRAESDYLDSSHPSIGGSDCDGVGGNSSSSNIEACSGSGNRPIDDDWVMVMVPTDDDWVMVMVPTDDDWVMVMVPTDDDCRAGWFWFNRKPDIGLNYDVVMHVDKGEESNMDWEFVPNHSFESFDIL
jgi:hypothetical protein